jgi:hypothetical protein
VDLLRGAILFISTHCSASPAGLALWALMVSDVSSIPGVEQREALAADLAAALTRLVHAAEEEAVFFCTLHLAFTSSKTVEEILQDPHTPYGQLIDHLFPSDTREQQRRRTIAENAKTTAIAGWKEVIEKVRTWHRQLKVLPGGGTVYVSPLFFVTEEEELIKYVASHKFRATVAVSLEGKGEREGTGAMGRRGKRESGRERGGEWEREWGEGEGESKRGKEWRGREERERERETQRERSDQERSVLTACPPLKERCCCTASAVTIASTNQPTPLADASGRGEAVGRGGTQGGGWINQGWGCLCLCRSRAATRRCAGRGVRWREGENWNHDGTLLFNKDQGIWKRRLMLPCCVPSQNRVGCRESNERAHTHTPREKETKERDLEVGK